VGEDFKQGATGATNADLLFLLDQNVGAVDFDEAKASLGYFGGGASVAAANVLTQETASKAIEIMDGAIEQVSRYRSGIGAQVNRLTSTVDNLSNVVINTEASRSRILDTDYAAETSKLAKAQIIQQAATAMLAQANQQPQTVLALLQ
jgi:flagellin